VCVCVRMHARMIDSVLGSGWFILLS